MDLSAYDNAWFDPGGSWLLRVVWFFVGLPLLRCPLLPSSGFRRVLLRMFGANVGARVVIKPGVRVKYPWRLRIGNDTWIGEDVWLDNLGEIEIGSNVCVSQGAYLCTGNHDWSDAAFGLRIGVIRILDGAWIGAKAILCPNVTVGSGGIASAGSVITQSIGEMEIWVGNPASCRALRKIGAKNEQSRIA